MADEPEDLRWIRTTANDLNNLLQVITESAEVLEVIIRGNTEAEKFLAILRNSAHRAAISTRAMVERAGGDAPTTPAQPAPAPAPTFAPAFQFEIYNPTGQRELILVVDDEDYITLLAKKLLADVGYRVVAAKNGLQALEIYRKLKDEISLVILDFTMPVMDGADVFAELQDMNPKVAVVLSSGFAEHTKLRSMLARGLRGFIPKPYTQEKLLAQVRQTLDAVQSEPD